MGEKLFSIFKLIREAKGYQNFTKPASGPISESENRSGRSHVIPCKIFSTPKLDNKAPTAKQRSGSVSLCFQHSWASKDDMIIREHVKRIKLIKLGESIGQLVIYQILQWVCM